MTAPCGCIAVGWCNRHKQEKSEHRFHLCQTREDYRAKWDSEVAQRICQHFGEYTGKTKRCHTCSGNVRIKLFQCEVYGTCTLQKRFKEKSYGCCYKCKEYKCLKCVFNENKCVHCGFILEDKIGPDPDTIIRECSEPINQMPLLYSREGNPIFYQNMYARPNGSSCFYIGGGPSLLKQDLTLFSRKHLTTFAVNNIAAKTLPFSPTMWCGVDEPKSFHDVILNDPAILKFIPSNKSGKHFYVTDGKNRFQNSGYAVRNCPNTLCFNINANFNHKTFLTEDSVSWGCDKGIKDSLGTSGGRSVMFPALRLMHYLGFKRIYLLGCDFNMQFDPKRKGKGLTYAFDQYKHDGGCNTNNKCYDIMDIRFKALRPFLEKTGCVIKNCTPDSKLTAFDYMTYEDAIAKEQYQHKVFTANMYG